MVRQDKKKGESVDSLLRKFKRKLKNEGVLKEFKDREYFEKPSDRRQKKLKMAVKRTRTQQKEDELI